MKISKMHIGAAALAAVLTISGAVLFSQKDKPGISQGDTIISPDTNYKDLPQAAAYTESPPPKESSVKQNNADKSNESKLKTGNAVLRPVEATEKNNNPSLKGTPLPNQQENVPEAMVFDQLDHNAKWIDFYVDGNLLYLIPGKDTPIGKAADGDTIEVYDAESQSPIRTLRHEKIKSCSGLAVKDKKIFTYDNLSGSILVFTQEGILLKEYTTGYYDTTAKKLEVDNSSKIYFMLFDNATKKKLIRIFDTETGKTVNLEQSQFLQYLDYDYPDEVQKRLSIEDFCIYDQDHILVRLKPDRLVLVNSSSGQVEKTSCISGNSHSIAFTQGILYYISDVGVHLLQNMASNFMLAGKRVDISRLNMAEYTTWTTKLDELQKWYLPGIEIPFESQGFFHQKIMVKDHYIYLLDCRIPVADVKNDYETLIYRVLR